MGLKSDIYKALVKNLGEEHIKNSPEGKAKVDTLATDLRDAIINFITKQEFNITEMEAPINFLPGTINVVGSPAAQANIAPITNTAQISETSNMIMDPRVPNAVKTSKVKLLQVKEA